jgi:hypothetical protein
MDNQEGNHNAFRVSLNSYKLKFIIKQNIIIRIERKAKGDWWDALGHALITTMLASSQLDAYGPKCNMMYEHEHSTHINT